MKYETLARAIDRHGGEWTEQVGMCSQCGEVVGFVSDGAGCDTGNCEGSYRPIGAFVDTNSANAVEVARMADTLEQAAVKAKNDGRRREKNTMRSVAEQLREAVGKQETEA